MYRDSLENSAYNNPSRKVLGEFAGNLQFCLLCQGALQEMISSMCGLFSMRGLAQSPTPMEIFALGKLFLSPFIKGVATKTSPKSLFLKMKNLIFKYGFKAGFHRFQKLGLIHSYVGIFNGTASEIGSLFTIT